MEKQQEKTKRRKKKSPLYLGDEYYVGTMTMEEAFTKALEPYFTKVKVSS